MERSWGAWVAQSVKRGTLDFGSGHDLTIGSSSPAQGSVLRMGACLGILCLPFSLLLLHLLSVSLSQNK